MISGRRETFHVSLGHFLSIGFETSGMFNARVNVSHEQKHQKQEDDDVVSHQSPEADLIQSMITVRVSLVRIDELNLAYNVEYDVVAKDEASQ